MSQNTNSQTERPSIMIPQTGVVLVTRDIFLFFQRHETQITQMTQQERQNNMII